MKVQKTYLHNVRSGKTDCNCHLYFIIHYFLVIFIVLKCLNVRLFRYQKINILYIYVYQFLFLFFCGKADSIHFQKKKKKKKGREVNKYRLHFRFMNTFFHDDPCLIYGKMFFYNMCTYVSLVDSLTLNVSCMSLLIKILFCKYYIGIFHKLHSVL